MTKRSKTTLFGLLALIAAFGLILTGCPDAAGGTPEPVPTPTDVRLTAGSHGFPYEDTIIGLEEGVKYVVRVDNLWYGVKANGTLLTGESDPKTAIGTTDAVVLSAGVDKITGLTKGKTYSVYVDKTATAVAGSTSIVPSGTGTVTGGKNTIVSLAGIAAAAVVTIAPGAGRAGSSLVVLTDANSDAAGQADEPAGAVTSYTRIKGKTTAAVSTYQFSVTAGKANLEAVKAGAKYFVIKDINAAFNATITAVAVTGKPILATAAGSQPGTESSEALAMTTGGKFVVQNRDKWYSVGANSLTPHGDDVVAAAAAAAATTVGTGIAGLTNDEVYSVYAYVAVTNTDIEATAEVKNTVYDYAGDKSVKFGGGAGWAKNTYVFIVDSPIIAQGATGGGSQVSGNAIASANTVKTSAKTYTLNQGHGSNAFAADGAKLFFTAGTKYFTITGGSGSVSFGLTRSS